MRRFFIKLGHRVLTEELVALMRRLDLDGDSLVTFHEFYEAVTPISIVISNR